MNATSGYHYQKDLAESIISSLKTFAKKRNLFWISGDIGVSWSLPIFYHYDTDLHITFIANGIGDTEEDYILKTDINKNDVSFLLLT